MILISSRLSFDSLRSLSDLLMRFFLASKLLRRSPPTPLPKLSFIFFLRLAISKKLKSPKPRKQMPISKFPLKQFSHVLNQLLLTWRLNSQLRHAGLDPASSAFLDSRLCGNDSPRVFSHRSNMLQCSFVKAHSCNCCDRSRSANCSSCFVKASTGLP